MGRSLIASALALIVLPAASSAAGFGESGASGTFNPGILPNQWAVDRFAPFGWAPNTTDPLGGKALKITLSNADRNGSRPGGFNSDFYNTQGRFRLSPGATEVSGKLFIPLSWSTPGNLRRSDIWARDNDPVETLNTRYLICGFINNDPTTPASAFDPNAVAFAPRFRAWSSVSGWTDLSTPVLYGQYNTIRMVDTGYQHEYYINGALVQVNSGSHYSVPGNSGLKQVILNSYNFGIAANSVSLPDSGYDVYWKDVVAVSPTAGGIPVDLNGSYQAAGSDANLVITGFGSATTDPDGDRNSNGQVFASASGVSAAENTFTPFSDSLKPPTALQNLDLSGKSFEAELDMGNVASWNDPFPGFGNDLFQLGLGRQAVQQDNTEESYVFAYRNNTHFSLYYNTDWTVFASPGQQYDADPAATKFRVRVDFNAAGTQATMTVTPLDGPDAGNAVELAPVSLDITGPNLDNVNNASFFAGFINSTGGEESGRVVVSNFKTNATTNSQFVFSDDPYNMSSETANFAVGQANLNAQVGGFQAFLQSNNLAGSMGFTSGSYTSSPYPNHNNPTITGAGDLTGYIALNAALTSGNFTLANILMNGADGTRGYINIKPNNGGVLDSQFNDGDGNAILADRRTSNIAMWDDQDPVVGAVTATQSGNPGSPNPVITGMLNIQVTSSDALTGLDRQPTISLDFAPLGVSPGDVTLTTFSLAGNNFGAKYNVPNTVPNGTGAIVVTAVDRAGNSTTTSTPMDVNTATLTLNIQLQTFASVAPTTVRGVDIRLGGTLGAGSQVDLSDNVTFNNTGFGTIVFNALDGIPNNIGSSYRLGVQDVLHTLRSTVTPTAIGNQATANATGADWLRGGNLNQDNKIDIGDYVVYATRFGIDVTLNSPFVGMATSHPAALRHANIAASGATGNDDEVDGVEFSYISTQFGAVGANPPGFFLRGDRTIRTRITVAQAMIESGSRRAADMDLNRDGVITMEEVQRYISRLR